MISCRRAVSLTLRCSSNTVHGTQKGYRCIAVWTPVRVRYLPKERGRRGAPQKRAVSGIAPGQVPDMPQDEEVVAACRCVLQTFNVSLRRKRRGGSASYSGVGCEACRAAGRLHPRDRWFGSGARRAAADNCKKSSGRLTFAWKSATEKLHGDFSRTLRLLPDQGVKRRSQCLSCTDFTAG